jgi:RNA polymerase sigma-54 factor
MATQHLDMTQRTEMRLTQQQLRYTKMLELNAPELDEAVERELEENEALEVTEEPTQSEAPLLPYYYQSRGQDGEDYQFTPADTTESLYDHLTEQLSERELPEKVAQAADFIIGSLDSNGYLRRDLRNLIDDMAFGPGIMVTDEEAKAALEIVRSLEPAGVGAKDLQDCLILQLERKQNNAARETALRILRDAYEAFVMKHRNKILSQLRISEQEADEAIALIKSLNPKPGATLGHDVTDEANVVIPDFIVDNTDGEITITLNNRIPELKVSQSYRQAVETMHRGARRREEGGNNAFIMNRYNDARDFIRILNQRQETMMTVMTAIVNIQKEYFLTEDVYKLRPMIIRNIAEITGLDISVISRATTNKFVATPWGMLPLRFFFSDTIGEDTGDTDAATNRKIEAQIAALVAAEDKRHPLSDQKIMEEMVAQGYNLSRRTVAKYRDRKGIPVARLRKEL